MATISTVAVDFIANTGKYTTGLDGMAKKTKAWSDKTKGEAKGVTSAFDNTTKSITNLAKGLVGLVAIQKVGAAFANAAAQVSLLADEAEKVGASAAQFDKLRLAAERNGSGIDTVKIAYKELQKSINEALGGTKTTTSAFKELGLSYVALSKQTPDQQFLRIAEALSKVEDQNDRTRLGNLLLGKSFTELAPLIAKGSAGIETGGRGSLSAQQIETIDKVTKSFEEVGRVLDGELKKALVALAPALTAIAKSLTFIIENIGKISIGFAVAFSPFILLKFQKGLLSLSSTILNYILNAKSLKEASDVFGGKNIIPTISSTTVESLSKFRIILLQVAAALGSIVSFTPYVLAAGASMALLALQTKNFIETLSDLPKFGGYLFPKLKPEFDALSKKVDTAKNRLYEFVSALAAATKAAAKGIFDDKPVTPFVGPEAFVGPRLPQSEYDRLAADQLDLDKMREAGIEFAKATDAFNKKSDDFRVSLEKSLMTPAEQLTSILEELDDAFLFGGLGIETYNRRLLELTKQYDAATAAAAGLFNGTQPSTADQKSAAEAGVRSSFFGVGTVAAPNIQLDTPSNRITDLATKLKDSSDGPYSLFKKQKEDIELAAIAVDKYGDAIMSAADKTYALDNATEQYGIASAEAFRKSNEEMFNIVMLTEDFASSLGQAIAAGQSFGEALKNVFQDLTKQIIAMIIRSIILQTILQAIGVVTGGVSSVAATAFASMMNIKPMAAGGPVKGGTPYQVGELGPELFVPEGNGYIVPNNMMGGESTQVVQNIYVQTGVAQTVRAEMLALLPQFRTQAVNAVLETKQRGGSFSKGMAFA